MIDWWLGENGYASIAKAMSKRKGELSRLPTEYFCAFQTLAA
jgi:hypothetical protein